MDDLGGIETWFKALAALTLNPDTDNVNSCSGIKSQRCHQLWSLHELEISITLSSKVLILLSPH